MSEVVRTLRGPRVHRRARRRETIVAGGGVYEDRRWRRDERVPVLPVPLRHSAKELPPSSMLKLSVTTL